MDVHRHGNSQLHYRVNGDGDNGLKFLSREEQECLQFFEKTIESLDDGLDDEQQRIGQRRHPDGLSSLAPNREASSQDIIDLVQSQPDNPYREQVFCPTHPGFHPIPHPPEGNYEAKPRRDSFPLDYNTPLRSASFGPKDKPDHSSYHSPGSVPTPVLIAQQIAENQGDGTSNLDPSSLLGRLNMESEKTPRDRSNSSLKHVPTTSVQPTHYPPNINVVFGGKERQKPVSNINIHEQQELVLGNKAGSSHHLLQDHFGMEQNTRNSPSRSISFKDPEPDKSRMEALSKLGLTRDRSTSLEIPPSSSMDRFIGPDTRAYSSSSAAFTQTAQTSTDFPDANLPIPPPVFFNDYKNTKSHDDRISSPTQMSQHRYFSPPPPEVTSAAFNTFGGKSIGVHPSLSEKNEAVTSPTSPGPKHLSLPPTNPVEHNSYGGKSKTMTPADAPVPRTNLPDILNSHIDTGKRSPAKPEQQPVEPNKYGGKSRTFNPVSDTRATSIKPPAPAPAPRPPRQSYHGLLPAQKPPASVSSPEYRRRPSSMFRPQGITVQFCGRGPMTDSRREALRRLGLFRD